MRRYAPALICMILCTVLLCSCSVKSKGSLISYAKSEYGPCEFVKEEVKGTSNDKVRTIWLIDKDTGIEYTVTSRMQDMNIDGSSFGYTESTSSDFPNLYWDYVIDNAQDDLDEIAEENDVDMSQLSKVLFNGRPSSGQAEAVAEAVFDTIKEYDVKGLLEPTIPVYAENEKVFLGILDGETGEWCANDSYKVIDYVVSVFPDAEYLSDIYGITESYVNSDDLDSLVAKGAKESGASDVEFYFFSEPKYGKLIAFDMEEIGLDGVFIGTYEDYGAGETLDCDALGIHP